MPVTHLTVRRGAHLLLGGALLGSVVTACGSSERAPFATTEGTVPVEPAPTAPPAAPSTPSTPTDPTPDAGVDAGSTCATAPPNHACGVAPQCGCTAAETCDVDDGAGHVACVTAGNAPIGHPCTATAGCARGLTCAFGTCRPFCAKDGADCGQPGTGACVQVQNQSGGAIPNLLVCRVTCALHDPTSCGGVTTAGVGVCMTDGKGATDCQAGGPKTEHQGCSAEDGCGPGLACVTVATSSTCRRWCRVGQSDCGAGATCSGFQTKVIVSGVEYGVCP